MGFELTDTPFISSDLEVIFTRNCSEFSYSPAFAERNEWMKKDIDHWESMFSDIPRFSALSTEVRAMVESFVTVGIRFSYLTFSNVQVVINNDFDTLALHLQTSSLPLYQDVLECLNELEQLSDAIMINTFPIDQRSIGLLAIIPLKEL